MKCQSCHKEEVSWSWQPFGPGEDAQTAFVLPGSHYRGFPVIKLCLGCKSAFESGDFPVPFTYKGFNYVGENHTVREVNPSFWDGGTSLFNGESATMIMKDTPGTAELIAMVCDPTLVAAFVALPDLIAVCQSVAEAFPEEERLSREQALAIAGIHNVLRAVKE
jgi:hypothetical protein